VARRRQRRPESLRDETYKRCAVPGSSLCWMPSEDERAGCVVEVTTLVVPDMKRHRGELADIAQFIAAELGVETPWHISRFHPTIRWPTAARPRPPRSTAPTSWAAGRTPLRLRRQPARCPPGGHLCPNCAGPWSSAGLLGSRAPHPRRQCDYCRTPIDGIGM